MKTSRLWSRVAVATALSLMAVIPTTPAVGASPTACKVRNVKTGVTKSSLRAAV